MANTFKQPRGTKANLNSLASSNGLVVGQVYLVTDEARLVVATATNAYSESAKKVEVALLSGATFTGNISAPNHLTTMGGFCSGKPENSEIVTGAIFPVATTITQSSCQAAAVVAATASTVFTIKNKTTSGTVGTITFAAGATLGTISITSGSVAANNFLYIEAPASADATLASIAFLVRS